MKKIIKNLSKTDQPFEKMLHKGPKSLSDAELLAILIGTGTKEKNAIELGLELCLLLHNNLKNLGQLSPLEISKLVKGIGKIKAVKIAAAVELGKRRQSSQETEVIKIKSTQDAYHLLKMYLEDEKYEKFYCVYLRTNNEVISLEEISSGTKMNTLVDIPKILKQAILYESYRIIVAHNHPSGNKMPSEADRELTKKLKESAKLMNIELLDHLIITHNLFYSFVDEGIL